MCVNPETEPLVAGGFFQLLECVVVGCITDVPPGEPGGNDLVVEQRAVSQADVTDGSAVAILVFGRGRGCDVDGFAQAQRGNKLFGLGAERL